MMGWICVVRKARSVRVFLSRTEVQEGEGGVFGTEGRYEGSEV